MNSMLAAFGNKHLRHSIATLLAATAATVCASADDSQTLRARLADLLRNGEIQAAVAAAQQALEQAPTDETVRGEYARLHVALAREWFRAGQLDAAHAALEAALAIRPADSMATALRGRIEVARKAVAHPAPEIERLLSLELFDAAIQRIRELQRIQPELGPRLRAYEIQATYGAADDHFLAGNFPEAFSLYERARSQLSEESPTATAPTAVARRTRWMIALVLALDEPSAALDKETVRRLRAWERTVEPELAQMEPELRHVLSGLLQEALGDQLAAGERYSAALGEAWSLPAAAKRRQRVASLRARAIVTVRRRYEDERGFRREGSWAIAIPTARKVRETAAFRVYAHNDLVAERVAAALTLHQPSIADWLRGTSVAVWDPPVEVHVHATLADLHAATGTRGMTAAVSKTRRQGDRLLLRRIDVYQRDPWLLSATLPHELTHVILADVVPDAPLPTAIEEGLAVHAEPAARRLQYRRLLPAEAVSLEGQIRAMPPAEDADRYYSRCYALVGWLLFRMPDGGQDAPADSSIVQRLQRIVASTNDLASLGKALGYDREADLRTGWNAWLSARRDPPRMPVLLGDERPRAPVAGEKGGR